MRVPAFCHFLVFLCLACSTARSADLVLFDFKPPFAVDKVATTDARAVLKGSSADPALRVSTGTQQTWPGIVLVAPGGSWDLSLFSQVVVDLKNLGTNQLTVFCRVDNPGADGVRNCVRGSLDLPAGEDGRLKVNLIRGGDDRLGGKLFGMRGYPKGANSNIDPKNITQVLLFVSKPKAAHQFEITRIRATGTYTAPTAHVQDAEPFFAFVDAFGQYKHRDWPGKTHSLAELLGRREGEGKESANNPGAPDWCRYGGWAAGPKFNATGFFRTEKYRGKWWLVDPDGHLFWSHGVDCVRMIDTTPITGREEWFEGQPWTSPDLKEFLSTGYALKGHYAGQRPQCFAFAGANLKRKYGPEWKQTYAETVHARLRSWGLNTIANWSDSGVFRMRRTPYTDNFGTRGAPMIEGSEGYWAKFPDVFDHAFEASVRRSLEDKKGGSAGDPWCIGYFSDNEMSWGDETSLALAALKSSSAQAAKRAFLADLKAKYTTVDALNRSWRTAHASWEAFADSREVPDRTQALADLRAFYSRTAETYFRIVRDALKAVAPNQLYLGCRFAWVNDLAAEAASRYCDVVSYNLYQRSVADFRHPGGDKPLIIGEFHFGALDRGLFHTGLVPVESQAARAQAYEDYVFGALAHPQFVGTHWFQWQDEPTTGRVYDEENYQIGLVDITDTPYPETIRAVRNVGEAMYRTRLNQSPTDSKRK